MDKFHNAKSTTTINELEYAPPRTWILQRLKVERIIKVVPVFGM